MKKTITILLFILIATSGYSQYTNGKNTYGNQNIYGGQWVQKMFRADTIKVGTYYSFPIRDSIAGKVLTTNGHGKIYWGAGGGGGTTDSTVFLTKSLAYKTYQLKGSYITKSDTTHWEGKYHASITYQPIGTYATGTGTASGTNTGDTVGHGALVSRTLLINGKKLASNVTITTGMLTDSTNKRFVTDAQRTVLTNTSGTNTGDTVGHGLINYNLAVKTDTSTRLLTKSMAYKSYYGSKDTAATVVTKAYLAGHSGGGSTTVKKTITYGVDGFGAVIGSTGLTSYIVAASNMTITGWSIVATGTAISTQIDIWKVASGTSLPTSSNSICGVGSGGAYPILNSGNAVRSSTLTGWTTATITAGDIIGINLFSVSGAIKITFTLETTTP